MDKETFEKLSKEMDDFFDNTTEDEFVAPLEKSGFKTEKVDNIEEAGIYIGNKKVELEDII